MAADDFADAVDRHAQAPRQRRFGMAGAQAKQQFVILATAQREFEIGAHDLAISRRKWNRAGLNFGADAAALQHMTEVLPESVAKIDGGGCGIDPGQPLSSGQPRDRLQKSINQKFSRRPARPQFTRQNAPSDRGISHRAGHENLIAGTRRIAPQHGPMSLAHQRDRNRERIGAGDVAAHDIGAGRARRTGEARIQAIEEARTESGPDRQIDHARSRNSAHRRDIAQVHRERACAEGLGRAPFELEMHALDD